MIDDDNDDILCKFELEPITDLRKSVLRQFHTYLNWFKRDSHFVYPILSFCFINPYMANINMDILHTVLSTFPKVLTGRNHLTTKNFFSW